MRDRLPIFERYVGNSGGVVRHHTASAALANVRATTRTTKTTRMAKRMAC